MPEISKTYEPTAIEEKWFAFWQEQGCFTADPQSSKPAYSIVIPPPNVTGVLTMGHVLNNTIQDILARRARMLGFEVLWLPGTDHAGIATQNVVEKTLRKEGVMKHRDELGREALVARIREWKEKYGGIIIQQLKKLGASCDWSRLVFTMDPEYSRCVQRVFVDLYRRSLIYRGKRMVNWDPVSLTALSDEEVEMKPQQGTLTYFKVEVAESGGGTLTIATTRPETIPGDTAIAVNPKDARYAHLIGKQAVRPLPTEQARAQRLIPIIGDEHVDFEFGTGVLKVTPAHDKADFEIGQRHGLPVIDIMNPDGTMNSLAGEDLAGLDRFEARKIAIERLTDAGALVKEEPYQNNVGYSERAQVPIEPRLSEQWFLKYPSVAEAREHVLDRYRNIRGATEPISPDQFYSPRELHKDGFIRFHPDRWAKVFDHWMTNIQDWCISRQLWWGHRVPVWRNLLQAGWGESCLEVWDLLTHPTDLIFGGDNPEVVISINGRQVPNDSEWFLTQRVQADATVPAEAVEVMICTSDPLLVERIESRGWQQDPDVLDTWFSSWLWPFATMGWPEKTETLARFYPTDVLVTGPDIIFFWVARMIMAGFEYMGQLPFRNVYFTGIIRDKQGRKMSKSLGNSPDPLDLIARYGADALRFGVMRSAPLGQDILFDEKNVELGRNFCTKLWNAARFRQMQGGETEGEIDPAQLGLDDKWILLRLDAAIASVSQALDEFRFSDAAQALYGFFWSEFCDWYLEASKAALQGEDAARIATTLAVIDFTLGHVLRLFHPFLPFITEELWHGLGYADDLPQDQGGRTISYAHWPKPLGEDFHAHYGLRPEDEKAAAAKHETVNGSRTLRRDFNIASNKRVRFVLKPSVNLPAHEAQVLKLLLNAETLDLEPAWEPPRGTPVALTPLGELFLPLEGLVDPAAERERLAKELAKIETEIGKVSGKLNSDSFVAGAPPQVVAEHRQRLSDWQSRREQLQRLQTALVG